MTSPRRTPDEEADLETARLLIVELEAALASQIALTARLVLQMGQYEARIAICERQVRETIAAAAAVQKPTRVVVELGEDGRRLVFVPAV